jgi:hypothetical protein
MRNYFALRARQRSDRTYADYNAKPNQKNYPKQILFHEDHPISRFMESDDMSGGAM